MHAAPLQASRGWGVFCFDGEDPGIVAHKKTLLNEEIRAPLVRLIGADGGQVGVVPIAVAQQQAQEAQLDLVEIVPHTDPPVCRIMDFGKFQFEAQKQRQVSRKKAKQIQIKEVKFRPGTGEGDYQIKLRNILRFLADGDRAKITLRFRGREMVHQEIGVKLLTRIEQDLLDQGVVEQRPFMEGRQMSMLVAPKKGKKAVVKQP